MPAARHSSTARRSRINIGSVHGEVRARSAERSTPKYNVFDEIKFELAEADDERQRKSQLNPVFDDSIGDSDAAAANVTKDDNDNECVEVDNNDGSSLIVLQVPRVPSSERNKRRTSVSTMTQVVMGHRRANSDPFDDACLEEDVVPSVFDSYDDRDDNDDDDDDAAPRITPLPTMQRFPYAATQNRNCWSEPPCDIFKVRGPNYTTDKKKVTAQKYLLSARGSDLFLTDRPDEVDMSKLHGALSGNLRKKPTLMIRLVFPWGILNQYYEVPPKLVPFMNAGPTYMDDNHPGMKGLSNSEKALAKWLAGDTDYRNARLKLIAFVPEGPWIVRNMVTGRPAIIGKKLPVKYSFCPSDPKKKRHEFLQVDLDVNSSKPTAKKIVSVCRRYMSSLGVDIGFLIEGKSKSELPEEMFGAIRLHQADPSLSHTLKPSK